MRKVEVLPHQAEWSKMFREESKRIKNVFEEEILNIFHIGSTAIPNINAKPVIDIMVEVINIENVNNFNNDMEQLGYEVLGENGISRRRFFRKGGDNRTHHVHIFEQGNEEISRHLTFRDYMIAHPEEAVKYSQLKQNLAGKFPNNIEKYIEGKNHFIKEIDNKAEKWRRNR
ncbi:GrpB family protein [Aquibacillus sp. 3ASR75-11]|uniref:GrpB family protein n=1 Tax=Terrihalobacillus insolitus TaxID=2950438 RepID=A0A9X3WTV2_9BACI|nr:GrpB family protein [Terrihalobacillus insolitus]MDC3413244.1 GrpB family protein [Terrihalobacillus insolitus]MDC3425702.1 GrpB family protein [Terrihalobacillus insolitus]